MYRLLYQTVAQQREQTKVNLSIRKTSWMNSITGLLDMEDSDIITSDTIIEGFRKMPVQETLPASLLSMQQLQDVPQGLGKRTKAHSILQFRMDLSLIFF